MNTKLLKLCKISISLDEDDTYYDDLLNMYIEATIDNLVEISNAKDEVELEMKVSATKLATIIVANVTYLFNNRESYVDKKSSNSIVKSFSNSIAYCVGE